MPNQQQMDVPVYLFTGFLDSGTTQFIQGSVLSDESFVNGDSILLLVCEEGENEYDAAALEKKNVHLELVENEIDLSEKILKYLLNKHKAKRVIMEFNGMWQLTNFYQSMPEEWAVYQEFFFADATTFMTYNANMRSLVVDKLQSCDMAVFNRFTRDMDKMPFHKVVRGTTRRAQIVYEYEDNQVMYDDIEDPLPFDMEAPVIEVKDEDYALWYRDITEEPKKYIGKTVELTGLAMVNRRFDPGTFALGRQIMTCCAADIQFCSLLARTKVSEMPEAQSWYKVQFKVDYKFHKLYGQKGPVLEVVHMEKTAAPEQEVATFF